MATNDKLLDTLLSVVDSIKAIYADEKILFAETALEIKDYLEDEVEQFDERDPFENAAGIMGALGKTNLSMVSATVDGLQILGNGLLDGLEKIGINIDDSVKDYMNSILDDMGEFIDSLGEYGTILKTGLTGVMRDALADYQDGVSETDFGRLMEDSWSTGPNGFLQQFSKGSVGGYNVKVMQSTPLDPGGSRENLYGTMMMGAPYLFNNIADPNNRVAANTIVKDSKFLLLTPGLPKYNGTTYLASKENNQLYQTETANQMLSYLLENGADQDFLAHDKRYYAFESENEEYFAYLEAMLNPIWIKLGLATDDNNTFNIFSFFNIMGSDGKINHTAANELKEQYTKSALGFFVNPAGTVSESIDNDNTSFGGELKSQNDESADLFARMNYITGMGKGSPLQNLGRKAGIASELVGKGMQFVADSTSTGSNWASGVSLGGIAGSIAKLGAFAAGTLIADVPRVAANQDVGAMLQSYAVTNGMKTMFPELWSNSNYTKSLSFDFNFTSPYGDPLSIFQHVYVPMCALLCFALPRQAADNGFVSPFFVRAELPGITTVDLGLIQSIQITRGGPSNLFTKDGIPRSISGTFMVQDLYPYLAMTKRFSFLSANPSYTMFLDSFCGLHALHDNDTENAMNGYFKRLLDESHNGDDRLWNKYSRNKQIINKEFLSNTTVDPRFKLTGRDIAYMRNK